MRRLAWLALSCLLAPAFPDQANAGEWQLASHCPPGFELQARKCWLRSVYQAYPSLQSAGVGGLRTGLPPAREAFSPQQIDLGRYLFFDPVLSMDGELSCATCHQPARGFSDGQGRSIGRDGKPLRRGAPSLWNVGFMQRLFWDGRADSLESQLSGPLYHPREMANTPENLLARLRDATVYNELFAIAFPDAPEVPTLSQLATALAAFQSSLVSLNSRYDRYAHGDHGALSADELEGLNIFRSFVARCAECHTPPLFTNQQIAVIGAPEPAGAPFDPGAGPHLREPRLRGGFRVPGLRNVALTAPYMHSGAFKTLREAVAFYTGGRGHAAPDGESLQLHWHIWEPGLSEAEVDRLVDFLHTLTDQRFMPREPERLPSGLPPRHTAEK